MHQPFEKWLPIREGYTSRTMSDEEQAAWKYAQEYAQREGMEATSPSTPHIFYDPKGQVEEDGPMGLYYNVRTDTYLDDEEAKMMGLGAHRQITPTEQ